MYEEVRGQSNLVNPDPFVQGEDKYILKNFEPTFTPIFLANPEMVVNPNTNEKNKHSSRINKQRRKIKITVTTKELAINILKEKILERFSCKTNERN